MRGLRAETQRDYIRCQGLGWLLSQGGGMFRCVPAGVTTRRPGGSAHPASVPGRFRTCSRRTVERGEAGWTSSLERGEAA